MSSLVVQVENRHGQHVKLACAPGVSLGVGRAWSNELVLGDPYVAPQQLRIEAGEAGTWRLQVLDATNPVLVNGQVVGHGPVAVGCGDRVTLGRSRLRLFAEDAAVEPTRRLLLSRLLHRERMSVLVPLLVLAAICGLDAVLEHVQYSVSLDWRDPAAGALMAATTVIVWAGIWSGVGQVLRHHHQFKSQLLASALVLLVPIVLVPLARYLQYPLNSVRVDQACTWGLLLGTLALLLKFNLYFATNIKHTSAVALAATTLLGMLSYAGIEYARHDHLQREPRYPALVNAPFAHLAPERSIDAYLADVAAAFAAREDE